MTANEYATLIFYWHSDPKPERLEELLTFLESAEWDQSAARSLGVAGVVLALELLYPDQKQTWRAAHRVLYRAIDAAVIGGNGRPEWADFYLGQWFVNHDPVAIDKILDLVADAGGAGFYARQVLTTAAEKCIPFKKALELARKSRSDAMILKAIQ